MTEVSSQHYILFKQRIIDKKTITIERPWVKDDNFGDMSRKDTVDIVEDKTNFNMCSSISASTLFSVFHNVLRRGRVKSTF